MTDQGAVEWSGGEWHFPCGANIVRIVPELDNGWTLVVQPPGTEALPLGHWPLPSDWTELPDGFRQIAGPCLKVVEDILRGVPPYGR